MITIENLKVLRQLLQHKSVTYVADYNDSAQSSISTLLKKMRDHFNDPLLIREGNQFELSAKGQYILDNVDQLVTLYSDMMNNTDNFDPFEEQIIHISSYSFFTSQIASSILKYIVQNKYRVKPVFHALSISAKLQTKDDFDETLSDAILGYYNFLPNFHQHLIGQDMYAVAHKGYFGDKKSLTHDEYMTANHVVYYIPPNKPDFLAYFGWDEPRNIIGYFANFQDAINSLTKETVITLPERVAKAYNLDYLPLPFENVPLKLYLFVPYKQHNSKKQAFILNLFKVAGLKV